MNSTPEKITQLALLGFSPNVISMVMDNLYSNDYQKELWVINNELKEISDIQNIWHPKIKVRFMNISNEKEVQEFITNTKASVFLGVYKVNTKLNVYEKYGTILKNSPNVIHCNSEISATTKLGIGNMINTGVVIAGHSEIGNFCSINRASSIGHHTKIGDFCNINPGATVCGSIQIEDNVIIGAGATVIDGIRIGKNSIIGAGSVVVQDIPANSLVMGVPGKVIKYLE